MSYLSKLLLIQRRELLYSLHMPEIKKKKTYSLRLTKFEILHVRDLMSILLPPDAKQTLSQALAASENRQMVESVLWRKIVDACKDAELPVGDDAPDYIVAPVSSPQIGVFQLAQEPDQAFITSEDEYNEDDDDRLFKGQDKEEE